jgi:cytochrome c556
MMSGRILQACAAAALSLAVGAGFALAGDAQVNARQDHMKANGAAAGMFAKVLKGEAPYDAAAVKVALDGIMAKEKIAEDLKAWDANANDGATVKAYTKAEIWSDPAGFDKVYKNYVAATSALAATTDEASFKTAFAEWGGSCKACHEKFRAPKE